MVFRGAISDEVRAYIKAHKTQIVKHGKGTAQLIERLANECGITTRTVYRLLKEPVDRVKCKPRGRKKKVSERAEKRLIRNIAKLRAWNKNWITRELMTMTDLNDITERTGQRILNRNGYHYLSARKKGVVSNDDCRKRLQFAKKWVKEDQSFWRQSIAFYFDGVGFVHKTNPCESATSCRGKVWRKTTEGLHPQCTAKGSNAGYGGYL